MLETGATFDHFRRWLYRWSFLRHRLASGRLGSVQVESEPRKFARYYFETARHERSLERPHRSYHHDRNIDRFAVVYLRYGQSRFPLATTAAPGDAGVIAKEAGSPREVALDSHKWTEMKA